MIGRRAKLSCSSKGRRRPSPVLLLNVADAPNSSGDGILCCSICIDDNTFTSDEYPPLWYLCCFALTGCTEIPEWKILICDPCAHLVDRDQIRICLSVGILQRDLD